MTMTLRTSNRILVQAAVILIFFWVIALILLTRPLPGSSSQQGEAVSEDVLQRLSRAVAELEALKERNQELQWILTNFTKEAVGPGGKIKEDLVEKLRSSLQDQVASLGSGKKSQGPSKEYEIRRRAVFRGVQEMWYFIHHELENLKKKADSGTDLTGLIQDIITSGTEHES